MSDETENTSGDQAKGEREHRFLFIDVWWWDALGGFFSVLGVLAALFGIYEYKQRVEASKASETLALIDVWETRGAREAYEKLSNEIASGFAQVPAADMTAAADDPALARVVSNKVAAIVLRKKENADAFGEVVYFFNRLGLCVEASLCSQKAAEIFFQDTLDTFIDVFGDQISRIRENRPRYAEAMLQLHEETTRD
ncbi:MAG: hypothetical protein CL535_15955 [Ahrensia sp.]|nr:hypothetical protein [Ahrensia sp.]|tara:strand:+ start:35491 stop:36081 length:591 start_codon:yes stop_codon:yes gene_type:complete